MRANHSAEIFSFAFSPQLDISWRLNFACRQGPTRILRLSIPSRMLHNSIQLLLLHFRNNHRVHLQLVLLEILEKSILFYFKPPPCPPTRLQTARGSGASYAGTGLLAIRVLEQMLCLILCHEESSSTVPDRVLRGSPYGSQQCLLECNTLML